MSESQPPQRSNSDGEEGWFDLIECYEGEAVEEACTAARRTGGGGRRPITRDQFAFALTRR